jgi:hypothetical protein
VGRARSDWNEDRVVDEIEQHLVRNAEGAGQDLVQKISGRTPRSAGAGHLPGGGHAADAVGYEVSKIPEGVRLRVGYQKRAFYKLFSELGTSRQAASPTVVPTVLESKQAIVSKLARG